ncbi:hypothetical protein B4Q13_20560 [Lacticaseibacillus rhamnosus]
MVSLNLAPVKIFRVSLCLLLISPVFGSLASAQQTAAEEKAAADKATDAAVQLLRQDIRSERKQLVAANLPLTSTFLKIAVCPSAPEAEIYGAPGLPGIVGVLPGLAAGFARCRNGVFQPDPLAGVLPTVGTSPKTSGLNLPTICHALFAGIAGACVLLLDLPWWRG